MEANPEYAQCHFSAECETSDLPRAYCLRALCQFVERKALKSPNIAWGGTKDEDWKRSGRRIKLRFTSEENRNEFERIAEEILPSGTWRVIERSNDDPARRQRVRQ
jgi:hypothetical protein